jgi:tryptophanyl-tRNA synthetase
MSKSYGNTIELFEDPKSMEKKVMRIVTDSKALEEPKDPDACPVFALYKLVASPAEAAEMAEKYRAGGYGYGHAKKELARALLEYLEPMRRRRDELMGDPGGVERILIDGARRAKAVARATMEEVRAAVGLPKPPEVL